MTRDYGREIQTVKEANDYYRFSVKIKKRTNADIQKAIAGDDDSIRYYSGRPGFTPVDEDLCFVFDKQSIKRILDMIRPTDGSDPTADGMILFNGARTREQSIDPDTNEILDIDGRPTVMLFPFSFATHGDPTSDIKVIIDKGTEHPGTGTKKDKPGDPPRDIYVIPETFKPADIVKLINTVF